MVFEFALNRRAFRHRGQTALLTVLWRLVTCQQTKEVTVIKNLIGIIMMGFVQRIYLYFRQYYLRW